jgi:hypothetical protein
MVITENSPNEEGRYIGFMPRALAILSDLLAFGDE